MKKQLLSTLFAIFCYASLSAQCCPYLGDFSIIPENPGTTDSVYLITNVTTPNQGALLSIDVTEIPDNTIKVDACYWEGMLTALKTFIDTINLGVFPAGDYTIDYTAISSVDYLNCNPIDSNQLQLTFMVSGTNATNDIFEGSNINCFPNPSKGLITLKSDISIESIKVYDLMGKECLHLQTQNSKSFQIDLKTHGISNGIYFLEFAQDEYRRVQKIVLQGL